jgi:hypothetical protein
MRWTATCSGIEMLTFARAALRSVFIRDRSEARHAAGSHSSRVLCGEGAGQRESQYDQGQPQVKGRRPVGHHKFDISPKALLHAPHLQVLAERRQSPRPGWTRSTLEHCAQAAEAPMKTPKAVWNLEGVMRNFCSGMVAGCISLSGCWKLVFIAYDAGCGSRIQSFPAIPIHLFRVPDALRKQGHSAPEEDRR